MKCSFIVSAFDRPQHLACLLRSLQVQTERDFEVLVTDNSNAVDVQCTQCRIVGDLMDQRFSYMATREMDCYRSANIGAGRASGEFLCFPSDDGYYTPRFLETMLAAGEKACLIYCDCLYDGHGVHYDVMDTRPVVGGIDKGGFLVRRSKFPGFRSIAGMPCAADGWLVEDVVKKGAPTAKAPGILWIHN